MTKILAGFLYFGSVFLFIALFIRFAWIKEQTGQMFPVYITPIAMVILAIALIGFYIFADLLFGGSKNG
jgi:hypothetical protein